MSFFLMQGCDERNLNLRCSGDSNPTVCDVCVFHTVVFGEMKLFAFLG